jgi:hypothetical protein
MDESIVPADAASGIPDIRDKELRDSFNRLIDRGAVVTLLFDSCHSGSITRGIPSGKKRSLGPSSLTISDPSDPAKPIDRGALILSAAQDDEPAEEFVDEDGFSRGVFTWALVNVLRTASLDDPAEDLYLRIRALIRAKGYAQEPVLAGLPERRRSSLFGGAAAAPDARHGVAVENVGDDGRIILQGGIATGLRPGAELVSVSDSTLAIRVVEAVGMARSVAVVESGDRLPETGDVFEIRTWISASNAPLRLYVPPSNLDFEAITTAAEQLAALALSPLVDWVLDPTLTSPTHVVTWTGDEWTLLEPNTAPVSIGPTPNPSDVASHLKGSTEDQRASLWVYLPPFLQLWNRLDPTISSSQTSVELVSEPSAADYLLAGRLDDSGVSYGWVKRQATIAPSTSPAPPVTSWYTLSPRRIFGAASLAEDLFKLDVIWGWLHLESPPDDGTFPYQFAGFQNVETGELRIEGDSLSEGELFRVVLRTTESELSAARMEAMIQDVSRRFVYIFAMDSDGNSVLLYPSADLGSVENDINLFTDLPLELKFGDRQPGDYLFGVGRPLGIDSFFILTSAEALPRPEVLTFSGVRTRGPGSGGEDETALSRLLGGINSASRGSRTEPVPTNWSLRRITVRSVEAR